MPVGHVSCVETVEVVGGLMISAVSRIGAVIAVVRIIGVVYVTVEAVVAMEPGTCSDEDATGEPFRTIVAVGSAVVRSVVIVAIRAGWCYADANGDLGLRFGRSGCAKTTEQRSDEKDILDSAHEIPHRV